jgi:hypothetical protein
MDPNPPPLNLVSHALKIHNLITQDPKENENKNSLNPEFRSKLRIQYTS